MGERIAALRRRIGMSQSDLAKKLGLSTSTISMYEQGRREPSVAVIIAMAEALGVTIDYMLTGRTYQTQDLAAGIESGIENKTQLVATLLGAAWYIGGQ